MRNFFLVISLLFLFSCDAPHDNPLDPENGTSKMATISGKIYTISLPRASIGNGEVIWLNEKISVYSNEDGSYSLELSELRDGWLKCKKENFFDDSVYVKWGDDKNKTIDFYLNSKPILQTFQITTNVVFSTDTNKSEALTVIAVLEDRDNDIDSVILKNSGFNYSDKLEYNVSYSHWYKSLSAYQAGLASFEELLGKEFTITVYDYKNRAVNFEGGYITRLITIMPDPITPRDDEVVQIPFEISWNDFPGNYNFNYEIQIFRNEIPAQLIYEAKNIAKDSTQVMIEENLPTGNYMWMLSVVDEFGNKVRSKPFSFKIGN